MAGGDELQGAIPLFVKADRMGDGFGIAFQRDSAIHRAARFGQQFHDPFPCRFQVQAGQLRVGVAGFFRIPGVEGSGAEFHGKHFTVQADHLAAGEPGFPPPLHVRHIAEGADHQDAGSFLRIRVLRCHDGDRRVKQGGESGFSEKVLKAFVFRMGGHRDTGGQQFRAGGGDDKGITALHAEFYIVKSAGNLAILHFRLGDRGLEVHVPHGDGFLVDDTVLFYEVQKGELGNMAAMGPDGGVHLGPVHGESQFAPGVFECHLVFRCDHLTGFDKIASADPFGFLVFFPGFPVRVIGFMGITADAENILGAPFRGQAVIVPSHGVEYVFSQHALETDDHVGLGVTVGVAHVE